MSERWEWDIVIRNKIIYSINLKGFLTFLKKLLLIIILILHFSIYPITLFIHLSDIPSFISSFRFYSILNFQKKNLYPTYKPAPTAANLAYLLVNFFKMSSWWKFLYFSVEYGGIKFLYLWSPLPSTTNLDYEKDLNPFYPPILLLKIPPIEPVGKLGLKTLRPASLMWTWVLLKLCKISERGSRFLPK